MTRRAPRAEAASLAERLLQHLGAQHEFAEAVLGDLVEEYASLAARDGEMAARMWYAREALRSAPHLVWNWFQHTSRSDRAQVAAVLAGIVLTVAIGVAPMRTSPSSPARIVGTDDGVIVNNELPVRLPVQVVDARGHALNPSRLRFRSMLGTPIQVSPTGVVTCNVRGDAHIRASLGALSRDLLLRCRPVSDVKQDGGTWQYLALGDSARRIALSATGPDGKLVDFIAGSATVRDTTVATVTTVTGLAVRPKAVGRTDLEVTVGDHSFELPIVVYARPNAPAALRIGETFVSTLRLASGDFRRWPLEPGALYKLSLTPSVSGAVATNRDSTARLVLAVQNANCVDNGPGQDYMCVALPHASVIVYPAGRAEPGRTFAGQLSALREYSAPVATTSQ